MLSDLSASFEVSLMADLEKDICLPENLEFVFKPFCKGCRIGDFYLDDGTMYWMDGQVYYQLTCRHLNACSNMRKRCKNESERVSE